MPFLFYSIPLLIFLAFFIIERRTIWIGFYFTLLTGYLTTLTIIYLEFFHQKIALTIVVLFIALIVLLIPFYFTSFIIVLITTGVRLIKREGRKLHNFLSLALGIFIILWMIVSLFITIPEHLPFLQTISFFISISITYIVIVMISFAVASLLNRVRIPWKHYDYIIVLGSGLIGDRVPPLLASRINKGIELFHKHSQEGRQTKLVFTGGKGDDELLAEGVAMANYAIEKGIDEKDIIIEDKAVSTYENLLFSKQLIDEDWKKAERSSTPNLITVTNNLHVFRALLWARKVGVASDGAGSKTKFYFWLNALIREFIAVLSMHKRFHLFIFIGLFILSIVLYVIQKFYVLLPPDIPL